MEEQLDRLVEKAWKGFLETPENERFLIAIGGIPGSGKTTLSKRLTAALNARYASEHPSHPPIAAFVPMDGFHLTRAQLDAMPDPVTAHARRGAAFTFDGEGFLRLVQRLREPLTDATTTVFAPSFDHAVKDPKENDIAVGRTHRIVVLEGNYILLSTPPWVKASQLANLRVFINTSEATARARLAARHLAAGIAATAAEADRRAVENDLVNGAEIIRLRVPDVHVNIESVDDDSWF
ncbi:P-loop containing nucleoside triphosphate hydrolase protein [Canariomyces notabilis]|uniref:P-loop containing nucleoside triphosphate hydrolase protein n=1 Tax=Canariomyces notabilis TaxID=2074819 RepID=A0AAN6TFL6_9PEZI|nr:P-loop containing nucleoside triphosphate hydrolase protein [Canariomyces arenarius]